MRKLLLLFAILFAAPLVFAQNWGSLPADFVLSNNTSPTYPPGTTMTLPIMTAASQSSSCTLGSTCTWTAGGEGTGSPSAISNFSVAANQTPNSCSNLGPVALNNSSTTLPTQSLNYNSIKFDATHNAQAGLQFSGSAGGITQLSGLMCAITPPYTGTGSDWDYWDFWATSGDYSVVQFNDTSCGTPASLANYGVRIEHGHPTSHGSGANICVHLVPETAYLFSHYYNFSTGQTYLSVWTPTGTLVGSISFQTTQTSDTFGWMSFGNGEGNSSSTPYYFSWMLLNWTTAPTSYFWTNNAPTSGIVAPSRVTKWTAGVTGGIPSGSYTQCVTTQCATVTSTAAGSTTEAQIQSAWASAPANTYVLLNSGTYSIPCLNLTAHSNVALRGTGANSTDIVTSSNCGGASVNIASSGFTPGAGQSITLTQLPSGEYTQVQQGANTISIPTVANLSVGNPIMLEQLNSQCDNGGIFVINTGSSFTCTPTSPGLGGPYSLDGGGNNAYCPASGGSATPNCWSQQQIVFVTSCNGVTTVGTSCAGSNVVVQFNPPLHMPNWSTSSSMAATWDTAPIQYAGIEDVTVDSTGSSGSDGIHLTSCSNCWVKGVSTIDSALGHVTVSYGTNDSIVNSYFFLTQSASTSSYGVNCSGASNLLVENNIFHAVVSPVVSNGSCEGEVTDYNYNINNYYRSAGYNENFYGEHSAGVAMNLNEGNISNVLTADNIHGSGNLNTSYRNVYTGPLPACWSSGATYSTSVYAPCNGGMTAVQLYSFHRFYNFIGNVVGTTGVNTVYNSGTATNSNVFGIGYGNSVANDPNVMATVMLWGTANSADGFGSPRFSCPEVGGGTAYINITLTQQPLYNPCPSSQTLPAASFFYSSKPSWWPNGKAWPLIGPDIMSGNIRLCTGGTQTRALVTSTTTTACTSAGGTTSIAFNGLANSNPAMDCYLSLGGLPNGTGAVLTNFSEATCYGGTSSASIPTCDQPTGIYVPALSVNCSTISSGAVICFTTDGSMPSTNGISSCSNGTLYSGTLTISSSAIYNLVAGGTGYVDSPIATYAYTIINTVIGGHAKFMGTVQLP